MNNLKFISILFLLTACAHDKAWVSDKNKNGGVIGYGDADDHDQVIKDFEKSAKKICGTRKWAVVREVIPPPTSAISATRSAASGDAGGAAFSGSQAYLHDSMYRSNRVDKNAKVEYGSPLKSWNEAEIRCR